MGNILNVNGWFDFTSYEVSVLLAQEEAEGRNIAAVRAYTRTIHNWELNRQQMGLGYETTNPIPEPPKSWVLGLIPVPAQFGTVMYPAAIQTDENLVPKYVRPVKSSLPDTPGFLRPMEKTDPDGPWRTIICSDIVAWRGKEKVNPSNELNYYLEVVIAGNFRHVWWERVKNA